MADLYQVIRRPLITEKALTRREVEGSLVFEVAASASKAEVKKAVEHLFNVKVASIRTANVEGKERKRGKFSGYLPDWKKAYVRLKAGEKVPDFAAEI
jgi:large subunit ribosomal protein L23